MDNTIIIIRDLTHDGVLAAIGAIVEAAIPNNQPLDILKLNYEVKGCIKIQELIEE